ncbi:MAG: hypothetical protein V5A55_04805 [Halovenus sp.]
MTESNPSRYHGDGEHSGVSRRSLLAGSAAVGATVTAGCLGGDEADPEQDYDEASTVFVFNTGNGTVSIIDVDGDEVVETRAVGLSSSFPSNQFTPRLTGGSRDPLWANVADGVRALSAGSLDEQERVDTGSGANWQELTPDGATLVVSAREPAHRNLRVDADPDSETFGAVTAELDRKPEDGRGDADGPGPCDVTIHPDGAYAYVPDLFGDTLTVIDIEAFEIVTQVDVDTVNGNPPEPWMGTAAWDGRRLLVEHDDGTRGSESIWDISDPADPVEETRLTGTDGLGAGPLTSEIGPASETGYVFTPGTDDVTVVDLVAGTVETRLDLGGEAFVGTWDPNRTKLYVPVQTSGEVVVIDADSRDVKTTIDVGPEPYGATAARVRPAPGTAPTTESLAHRLEGLTGKYETTYCIGECACGHQL